MVELLLFLSTFCVFFFLPVQFEIFYQKIAWDDTLVLEMTFLNGLLRRKKEINLIQPTLTYLKTREINSGNWFFYHKSEVKEKISPNQDNSRGLREFLHRYRHFGTGMTLLTYFLPARYQRWLLVVGDLERKGQFTKFNWSTRVGAGNPVITSIVYGFFWALKSGLLNYLYHQAKFTQKPELKVVPDYQNPGLDIRFNCIFRVKLGYIITAAFLAMFRHRLLKGGVGIE